MWSIYKKEIAGYFNSLVGYLSIALFLLLSGLIHWVFPDTAIPEQGYASMDGFFALSPYLLLFLIPAVTMRSLAGERAEGTLEWLRTKPLTESGIVLGKFLGSLTIIALALLPTLIYVYSLYVLALPAGNVDLGSILGSYIGLLLLGAGFAAIGICASAMSPSPVIAFLLALLLCFFAYYGMGALAGLSGHGTLGGFLLFLGMESHYEALGRGVLDSRDVLYFAGLIYFFLYVAYAVLNAQRRPKKRVQVVLFQVLTVLTAVVAVNYAGTLAFGRVDFTQDRRYSLAPISKSTLSHLHGPVKVTVLLDGDLPPGFQRLKQASIDLLSDFKAYAKGNFQYTFVHPSASGLDLEKLPSTNLSQRKKDGSLTQQLIYPLAILSDGTDEVLVDLSQHQLGGSPEVALNHSIENLEYAFVSALRKMGRGNNRPVIGFTEGNGELSDLELYDAMHSLAGNYQVGRIDLDAIDFKGLDKLDVLVIAKPTRPFTEAKKYKIDYFLMQGGNLVWALDQLDGSLDSLRASAVGVQTLLARELRLDDQLFTYGLRFNYDVIADLNCNEIPMTAVGGAGGASGGGGAGQGRIELVPWPMHPVFVPVTEHPLLKNLDGLLAEYAGTLDTLPLAGIRKEILLHSSPYVRTLEPPASLSLSLIEDLPAPEQIATQPRPVVALLEGRFTSAFEHRPVPAGAYPATGHPGDTGSHRPSTRPDSPGAPARIIAISDGDLLRNQVNPTDQSPYPLGWDRYTGRQYGNKAFLYNLIDYLTDDSALIGLRDKEVKLRLLDGLKLQQGQTKWQLINVALPVLLVFLAGLLQQYLRRRRYGRYTGM